MDMYLVSDKLTANTSSSSPSETVMALRNKLRDSWNAILTPKKNRRDSFRPKSLALPMKEVEVVSKVTTNFRQKGREIWCHLFNNATSVLREEWIPRWLLASRFQSCSRISLCDVGRCVLCFFINVPSLLPSQVLKASEGASLDCWVLLILVLSFSLACPSCYDLAVLNVRASKRIYSVILSEYFNLSICK